MELSETLNRTMKLAMDEGRAGSYQEAVAMFSTFSLRIHAQSGFSSVPAKEAAILTLLNAAPKTFLGGVSLEGALDEVCTMAWFAGKPLRSVAEQYGVTIDGAKSDAAAPLIVIGKEGPGDTNVLTYISFNGDEFVLSPEWINRASSYASAEVGVAAAGAALSEAFQHTYRRSPLAGQREIHMALPRSEKQQVLEELWIVGLGHLGQAYLWTAALSGVLRKWTRLRVTDYDVVSLSSLSTCLLVDRNDVGTEKVDAIARRLELLGVSVQRDVRRVNLDEGSVSFQGGVAVIAVDNVALRRSLDKIEAKRVLEGGIGDGPAAYTRVQIHSFPGARKASDVWADSDTRAARVVDISKPAYQSLLKQTGDECGTTLVAGRSIATPFVGAFAGAMMCRLSAETANEESAWNYDVNSL